MEKLWSKIGRFVDKETGGQNKEKGIEILKIMFEKYDVNGVCISYN
jgi:hypothetical protein